MTYQEILKDIQMDLDCVENELKKYAQNSQTLLGKSSNYLIQAGGKRLRPAFVLLAGKFCSYDPVRLRLLAVAIELFHMATLVHDDVIDGAFLRRGLPAVRIEWGDSVALYTGDYLFAQALTIISNYGNEQIARILAEASLEICEGEIEQIKTIGKIDQGIRDYLRRIKRKTALLISSCCLIGALAVDAPSNFVRCLKRFGYYLGMAFQITDDILDFVGSEDILGKPVGSDLKQGIITLPTIFALKDPSRGSLLKNLILKKLKEDSDWDNMDWNEAIDLIKNSGAIKSAKSVCDKYLEKAKKEVLMLPDLPPRKTLLTIIDFVQTRTF